MHSLVFKEYQHSQQTDGPHHHWDFHLL